jgi:hypothetical protein
MVRLGRDHIAEGTDHLLFLLVLLLPSALIAENKRWSKFGGTKYSFVRVVKIVTAFTIGHSISLLLGAMNWVVLPAQLVEIAIVITIFCTAIHAIRPLFFGKEIFIAVGFGLVHGLAFATVLTELSLAIDEMAISILGFNIGIELMQLFVIICTIPWLILLAHYSFYSFVRIIGALIAIIASIGWLAERISMEPNFILLGVQTAAANGKWIVLGLAFIGIVSSLVMKKSRQES